MLGSRRLSPESIARYPLSVMKWLLTLVLLALCCCSGAVRNLPPPNDEPRPARATPLTDPDGEMCLEPPPEEPAPEPCE